MQLSEQAALRARGRHWPARLATLGVILLAIVLRHPGHFSADATIAEHDWFALHRPDAAHIERAVAEDTFPWWSPWLVGGTPLFSVPTKPFSYPPLIAAVLALGPDLAMNVLLLAHVLLGAIGMAVLAQRLGARGIGPAACAVLFVLARFPALAMVSTPFSFGCAIAWWPWLLLGWVDLLEQRHMARGTLVVGVLAAAQWHAGGEPALYWLAWFLVGFSVPYLLRRRTSREWMALGAAVGAAAGICVGLAAVKLLPELAWLKTSGRGVPLGVDYARDSEIEERHAAFGSPLRTWTLLRSTFELLAGGGRWTLLAGLLLASVRAWRQRAFWALALGAAVCFVLASGELHELAYDYLPGYDRMRRHSRFVIGAFFGVLLLAGLGLQSKPFRGAQSARVASWVAGLALALGVLLDTSALPGARYQRAKTSSASERLALTSELYSAARADRGRFRIHHEEPREQGVWIELGLESTGGSLGGPRSRHPLLLEALPDGMTSGEAQARARGVLDVLNVRYLASYTPLDDPELADASLAPERLDALRRRLDDGHVAAFRLYARPSARARACKVSAPTLVVGAPEIRRAWILERLRSPGYDAWHEVLIESNAVEPQSLRASDLEGIGALRFPGRSAADPALATWSAALDGNWLDSEDGAARWLPSSAEPTHVDAIDGARLQSRMSTCDIDVAGSGTRFLLLAELFAIHPGWSARVDGEPVELERTDGLVTLLRLPPGASHVTLRYRVPGLAAGAGVTLATCVALCGWGIWFLRKRVRARTPSR
jgi:hypothetical protein